MSLNDHDPIATRLIEHGYDPVATSSEFSSDGSIRREWAAQAFGPIRIPNGSDDYTPPQFLAVVSLQPESPHEEKFSKVAGKLADALVKLLATPGGPLVRRTPKSLQFVYRLEGIVPPRLDDASTLYVQQLFQYGLAARDSRETLVLIAGTPEIPVGDDATWLGDRSPLTVARTALAELDEIAASIAIAELVDRFVAAGDIRICGRYLEPARPLNDEPAYLGPSLDVDPRDWDPADPRRKSSGLIAKVRELRSLLMGGAKSESIDNDQLRAKLQEQRTTGQQHRFYGALEE